MTSDENKAMRSNLSDSEQALVDIAHQLADQAPTSGPFARAEVELTMADLVSDDNGEIVFFNDSGFRSLAIQTDSAVVADGRTDAHVTAAGEDVSGFKYVTFDNGLTLYFEDGLDLVLSAGASCSPS